MGQNGRVWKWTGMVLAVLCAALALANFLLTRVEEQSTEGANAADWVQNRSREGGTKHEPPQVSVNGDVKSLPPKAAELKNNSALPTRIQDPRGPIQNPPRGGAPKSKIENPPAEIENHRAPITNLIRPLGIVETAGGRVQAVIQDGEWTRLVEEGEVLADNSRVLKVSAEGVEILRPASLPAIELARAGNAPAGETKPEIAVAAQSAAVNDEPIGSAEPVQARGSRAVLTRARASDDLPGMQTGEATFHAAAPKLAPSVVRQRALKPALPSPMDLRPSPLVGIERPVDPNAALGRVEHADGRVQAVVADGQWVKLVAEPATSGPDFNQAKGKSTTEASGMGAFPNSGCSPATWGQEKASKTAPMTSGGGASRFPLPGSGLSQTSESEIPNSAEPVGIVEWPDGRTQSVIIQGLSVSLVDDAETLAEARRALALVLPPGESGIDPRIDAAEQAGSQREDESVEMALAEDEFATRGPPGELEPPLGLPAEVARGQPEDDGLADPSRAPPLDDSLESSLLEDQLPGFEAAAVARTEPPQSFKTIPDAILGRSRAEIAGSVSEIHSYKNLNALLPPPIALGNAQNPAMVPEPSAGHEQNTGPKVLGYVRMLDGRQWNVVSAGNSVMLVEEAADARAVQSERPAPAGHEVVTSHPQTGGTHPTAGESSGSGLQSGPRIRDNQAQTHR
jgi:hypothetical protein